MQKKCLYLSLYLKMYQLCSQETSACKMYLPIKLFDVFLYMFCVSFVLCLKCKQIVLLLFQQMLDDIGMKSFNVSFSLP